MRLALLIFAFLAGDPARSAEARRSAVELLHSLSRSGYGELTTVTLEEIPLKDPVPAFTQGFEFLEEEGVFLLSSGALEPEKSPTSLRVISREGNTLTKSVVRGVFGEGLTVARKNVVQLTWEDGRALVWRLKDVMGESGRKPWRNFRYPGEGWGLASDGRRFLMSDGSSRITFRSLGSFKEQGGKSVRLKGDPLTGINELEYIGRNLLLANVWSVEEGSQHHGKHPYFYVIDLGRSGDVARVIAKVKLGPDIARYLNAQKPVSLPGRGKVFVSAFNGIASDGKALYLTGKYWDRVFKVGLK